MEATQQRTGSLFLNRNVETTGLINAGERRIGGTREFRTPVDTLPDPGERLYAAARGVTNDTDGDVMCPFHTIETSINMMAHQLRSYKNLDQIQLLTNRLRQPCLFGGAVQFGGSECSDEVFNCVCTFHWKMMNLRPAVCEGYTIANDKAKDFRHYELLIDNDTDKRTFTPIFPYIDRSTTMYDLLFGFSYATEYGLQHTKKNEGAAMAYALYYMVNPHCRNKWSCVSSHWAEAMTSQLMAFLAYNDVLFKSGYITPNAQTVRRLANGAESILRPFYTKNVVIRNMDLPYGPPENTVAAGTLNRSQLGRFDAIRPSGEGARTPAREADGDAGEMKSYHSMSIFMAPLIMGLRPSTFALDRTYMATNPNISVFRLKFQNDQRVKVFAIEGPVMYGVTDSPSARVLPFHGKLPRVSMAYVASLAAVTNLEPHADRIFASETAKNVTYTVDSTAGARHFRMVDVGADAGVTLNIRPRLP